MPFVGFLSPTANGVLAGGSRRQPGITCRLGGFLCDGLLRWASVRAQGREVSPAQPARSRMDRAVFSRVSRYLDGFFLCQFIPVDTAFHFCQREQGAGRIPLIPFLVATETRVSNMEQPSCWSAALKSSRLACGLDGGPTRSIWWCCLVSRSAGVVWFSYFAADPRRTAAE